MTLLDFLLSSTRLSGKKRRNMEDGVAVAKPSSDIVARGADDAIIGENGDHRKDAAIMSMTPARLAVMLPACNRRMSTQ